MMINSFKRNMKSMGVNVASSVLLPQVVSASTPGFSTSNKGAQAATSPSPNNATPLHMKPATVSA